MILPRSLLPILIALPLAAAPVLAQQTATPADAPPQKRISKGEQQALQWFEMLDTDKDGRISRKEAAVAIRLSSKVADYFREADLNGDGYLTQQEIRTVADRRRAERQRRRQLEAEQAGAASNGTAPVISKAAAAERAPAR